MVNNLVFSYQTQISNNREILSWNFVDCFRSHKLQYIKGLLAARAFGGRDADGTMGRLCGAIPSFNITFLLSRLLSRSLSHVSIGNNIKRGAAQQVATKKISIPHRVLRSPAAHGWLHPLLTPACVFTLITL